jgi:Bacterial Ig-like domain (group 3)/NHL repeat/IPT/TIG domain
MNRRIYCFLFALVLCLLAFACAPSARAQFTVDAYITAPSGSGPLTGTCTNEQWENNFFSLTDPSFGYPVDDYLYAGQSVYECDLYGPNGLEDSCYAATNVHNDDEAECTATTTENPASGTYQVVGRYSAQTWFDSDTDFCGEDSQYWDPLDLEDVESLPSFNGQGTVTGSGGGFNCTAYTSFFIATSQASYTLNQVAVSLSPTSTSVAAGGQPVTFSANVTNAANTSVTWSSNTSGTGTFTPNGTSASYTPPAYIASQSSFQVTATSVQDPLQSATATLIVNPLIPTITSVSPPSWNAGSSFTLTINGTGFTSSTQVQINSTNWPISPSNYSCSPPTTSTSISCGLSVQANLAPASSGGATITVSDGSFSATYPASGTIPIVPIIYTYTVTLAVPSPSLTYGYSTSITPTVTCKTSAGPCASNVSNPQEAVFALTSGPGNLTGTGLQTATTFVASTMVAYPSQNSSVQACAPLQTASCASTNISTAGVTISLNPSSLQNPLTSGATQTFSASVQNPGTATTNALTWSLSPNTGTLTSAATTISGSPTSGTSSNTYHAPSPITSATTVNLSACMTVKPTICSTPVSISLTPPPTFTFVPSPPALTVQPNDSASATFTTTALYGFNSAIACSAGTLPAGVTVTWNPGSVSAPGSGACSATFSVSSVATAGVYPITITGTGGGITQPTTVTLTVPNFTLSANLTALTVDQGSSGSSVLTLAGADFPAGSTINLAATGQPSGVTVSFSGNSVNPNGTTNVVVIIAASSSAQIGTATITVTVAAQPAGAVQTVPISLTVNYAQSTTLPGAGIINTVAGQGPGGYTGDGELGIYAELDSPTGVAVDSAGNIYIADQTNNRVRKLTVSTGAITTVAGDGIQGYNGDGIPAIYAELYAPSGVALDSAGNIYIADEENERIRKVNASTGIISTVAGNGTAGYNNDGIPATSANLYFPTGVAVDSAGNIYIADWENDRIREVNASTGNISTVAGNGTRGFSGDGAAATSAELNFPSAVTVDSAGNIYVTDFYNVRVRKVTVSTGYISTIAGNGTYGYNGDGILATSAELNNPNGIAVDTGGNLYIADETNERIRKVTASTGDISTIAGNGTTGYLGDWRPATSAELDAPDSVAVDASWNVYISDGDNNAIRAVGSGLTAASAATSCSPGSITYGTSATCTATVHGSSPTGTVSFSYNGNSWTNCTLSSGSCSVSGLSSAAAGSYTVAGSYSGNSNNTAASGSTSLAINPATPTIGINNIPTSARYGGSFTPTYTYSGGGSPTETAFSSTTGVCTVSGSTVNFVGGGTCTLTANSTATTNYAAATGSAQSFTVSGVGSFTVPSQMNNYDVVAGNTFTMTLNNTLSGGFSAPITMSASTSEPGLTATFSPNPIPAPGSGSYTITLTATASAPGGEFPVILTGTGGGVTESTTWNPYVTNFSVTPSPAYVSVTPGHSGTSTITVNIPSGPSSPAVSLSASGQPSGVTVSFSPSQAYPGSTINSTMTITVPSGTAVGSYPITVTGSGGSITHTTTVTLNVPGSGSFTIPAQWNSFDVIAGSTLTLPLNNTLSGGFNAPIIMSASSTQPGLTATFSPNPISAPGSGSYNIIINAASTVPGGQYPITLTGTGGGITQSVTWNPYVTNFSVTPSPASVSVNAGSSGTSTITVNIPSGPSSQTVSLSASGQPSGVTVSFSPSQAYPGSTTNSTMTITVPSGTPTGIYPITVSGTGGSITQIATVTLTVP